MTADDNDIPGKFVLVISDMPVGSAYGLLPEGFVGSTGAMLNLNTGQQYLWVCWGHFIRDVPPKIDTLIVNGDAIDGRTSRSKAASCARLHPSSRPRVENGPVAPAGA